MGNNKKIDNQILFKRIEYLAEKLEALEAYVQFDPKDYASRLTRVENLLYASKEMLSLEEACFYLNISKSLLYKLTSANVIPHFKPRGKMVYFSKNDLDEWIRSDQKSTIEEAKAAATLILQEKAIIK